MAIHLTRHIGQGIVRDDGRPRGIAAGIVGMILAIIGTTHGTMAVIMAGILLGTIRHGILPGVTDGAAIWAGVAIMAHHATMPASVVAVRGVGLGCLITSLPLQLGLSVVQVLEAIAVREAGQEQRRPLLREAMKAAALVELAQAARAAVGALEAEAVADRLEVVAQVVRPVAVAP